MANEWWTQPEAFKAYARFGSNSKLLIAKTDYHGGLAEHPKPQKALNLTIGPDGLEHGSLWKKFSIPWGEIESIEVEGPEQAGKRVTASRVAMVGVFALIARKKVKSAVITVSLRSGEQAVFQTHAWMAADLKLKLVPILSQMRQAVAVAG